ncbi:hypothetical protein ANN_22753, partial [Periplaneta americana]
MGLPPRRSGFSSCRAWFPANHRRADDPSSLVDVNI